MSTAKQNHSIDKDTTRYSTQNGFTEYDFGECNLVFNPATFAGLRIEQIDTDRNGKRFIKKINLSHRQAKDLKKLLRHYYPRD
jgi:hypothetical protein